MAGKTAEERITVIDEKIAKKKAEIESLEAQKQKLLHPVNMKMVMAAAKEAGLTPEEIAEKLGLEGCGKRGCVWCSPSWLKHISL